MAYNQEKSSHGNATHGLHRSKEYAAWQRMRSRCLWPEDKDYAEYGSRGIGVAEHWYDSFQAFLDDVGVAPSPEHSLGRIDNEGDYILDNVRWETALQQANNKRNNRHITFDGETRTLSQWARHIGVSVQCLHKRLKLGWPPERALR